jgi:hypothetical protein
LANGAVDLLVDREAEHDLAVAGVVVEEVNAARGRIGHDRLRLAGPIPVSYEP